MEVLENGRAARCRHETCDEKNTALGAEGEGEHRPVGNSQTCVAIDVRIRNTLRYRERGWAKFPGVLITWCCRKAGLLAVVSFGADSEKEFYVDDSVGRGERSVLVLLVPAQRRGGGSTMLIHSKPRLFALVRHSPECVREEAWRSGFETSDSFTRSNYGAKWGYDCKRPHVICVRIW